MGTLRRFFRIYGASAQLATSTPQSGWDIISGAVKGAWDWYSKDTPASKGWTEPLKRINNAMATGGQASGWI